MTTLQRIEKLMVHIREICVEENIETELVARFHIPGETLHFNWEILGEDK